MSQPKSLNLQERKIAAKYLRSGRKVAQSRNQIGSISAFSYTDQQLCRRYKSLSAGQKRAADYIGHKYQDHLCKEKTKIMGNLN